MSDSPQRSAAIPASVLSDELWRIAVASGTPIGFESADPPTHVSWVLRDTPNSGRSLTQALDMAIGADDRYEWRKIQQAIVVRPKSAWADQADPLNRQVHNLSVKAASPTAVLFGVRDLLDTNQFTLDRKMPGTVSFYVGSGTVLDVLNQLTVASDQVMWIVSYRTSNPETVSDHTMGLVLELKNSEHVTSMATSHKLVLTRP